MKPIEEFQWVRPGLAVWGGYDAATKVDCCSTAIKTSVGLLVIDPIPLSAPAMEELGKPSAIYLTSGNHQRDSLSWKTRFGIPVHAPESSKTEIQADHWVRPGENPVIGAKVIDLPGGATGESALLIDDVLIVGDAIINLDGLAVLPAKYCNNPKELTRSLPKLLELSFTTICFAHGWPIVRNAKEALDRLPRMASCASAIRFSGDVISDQR